MSRFKTEQERFWAGAFGDEYSDRNAGASLVASNVAMFTRILSRTHGVRSVLELGANVGLNLRAIRHVLPGADLSAVEINGTAVERLREIEGVTVFPTSLLDFQPDAARDFVLIKGVLIHINPDELPGAYDLLYRASARYVCVAEYYNPSPVEIPYRGHAGKLFKRDFAGELMARHPDLRLVDYGFIYRGDLQFPQDDITWFLMEKAG